MLEVSARKLLNEESYKQSEEGVQNAARVLLSALYEMNVRLIIMAWDAPGGLLATQAFLAKIHVREKK